MEEARKRTSIQGPVLDYMSKNLGVILTAGEIADATGRTVSAVKNAMYNIIIRNPDLVIETVIRGNAWRYTGKTREAPKISRPIFEQIHTAKDGTILLADEAGGVWRASEL